MQRDPTTVAQHLSADVLADGGGSWLTADKQVVSKKVLHCASLSIGAALPDTHSPSRCSSMLVLSRFLARATSLSVTLVQRDVLTGSNETHDLITHGIIMVLYSDLRVDCSYTNTPPTIYLLGVGVCVLTIPSE